MSVTTPWLPLSEVKRGIMMGGRVALTGKLAEWVDAEFLTVETRVRILLATCRGKGGYMTTTQLRKVFGFDPSQRQNTEIQNNSNYTCCPHTGGGSGSSSFCSTQLESRKYSKQDMVPSGYK